MGGDGSRRTDESEFKVEVDPPTEIPLNESLRRRHSEVKEYTFSTSAYKVD